GVRILRQRAEHLKGIRQAGAARNPPIPPLSAWRTLVVGDYRLGDGCECHCKSGRFGVIASGRSRLWRPQRGRGRRLGATAAVATRSTVRTGSWAMRAAVVLVR